jgi:hypothetical protein
MRTRGFDTPSPPRSSSEFEEVDYPSSFAEPYPTEELPLHYMEDKARRRIKGPGGSRNQFVDNFPDDGGKDVYGKERLVRRPVAIHRRHPTPPTNIVRNEQTVWITQAN